jgi:alpha-beta hydrolase superfamily lysophospholipase
MYSTDESNIEVIAGPAGVKTFARVYGKDGPKNPLIMLHGLQSHSGWFTQSASFIAGLGIPVYSVDRYGSGLSEAPRGGYRSINDSLDDIDAAARFAMENHSADKVYLLGHCFGAIGACLYTSRRRERVKALIMPTPAIFTKNDLKPLDKLKVLLSRMTWSDIPVPVPLEPSMMSELDEYIDFAGSDNLALRYASGRFFYDIPKARRMAVESAGSIKTPVFMALSGLDRVCDNGNNRAFFDSLGSEDKILKVYPGARHILEFSKEKEAFFGDLAGWLRGQG